MQTLQTSDFGYRRIHVQPQQDTADQVVCRQLAVEGTRCNQQPYNVSARNLSWCIAAIHAGICRWVRLPVQPPMVGIADPDATSADRRRH